MTNLIYLATYALIGCIAFLISGFAVALFALTVEAVKEHKRYLHIQHTLTHKRVENLKRYHVGGFIREHGK